jgi:hypothetical protein
MTIRLRETILTGTLAAVILAAPMAAQAACYVVSRTNDGVNKSSAVAASQMAFDNDLRNYKRTRGWRRITSVRARRVRPDPLWKAVRTSVPRSMILKPDVRTSRHHTVCWPGVVSPVVCTTGALVCGN